MAEHPSVTKFREYIRIKTVHPNPDYGPCVKWLEKQAENVRADAVKVVECTPGKPLVIVSFIGSSPELPSVMLSSHMDVVPVFPDEWKYEPFSAHKEKNGDIYGRGTQDMKSVGIQYLEAITKLRSQGTKLARSVHLIYTPEEELGSTLGMKEFVKMKEFKDLRVGFVLDEGYANPSEEFYLFYGERTVWRFFVRCPGQPGHGSQFLPNTAGEKLEKVITSFLAFRSEQENLLKSNPQLQLGEVTTLNLTMLDGGVQFNVVPAELSVGFDVRIAPSEDFEKLEERFRSMCREAGEGVSMDFVKKNMNKEQSCVTDGQCKWWDAFASACKKENISLVKTIFPASTDSKFVRELGIPALGFSPMNKTPILLHDHNEYLNEKIFLRGIDIYCTIISCLANVTE